MKKIYITTGTADYLKSIEKRHPDQQLMYMENIEHALLLHETTGKSIFQMPRTYDTIDEGGSFPPKGFAAFQYVPVLEEEKPAFEYARKQLPKSLRGATGFIAFRVLRPAKGDLYALFTCWDKETSFKKWQKHADFPNQIGMKNNPEISKLMNYPNPSYYKGYTIGHNDDE